MQHIFHSGKIPSDFRTPGKFVYLYKNIEGDECLLPMKAWEISPTTSPPVVMSLLEDEY
jgi:hypothetical protein